MKKNRSVYIGIFAMCFIMGMLITDWEVQRKISVEKNNLHNLLVNQATQLTNSVSATINQVYPLRALVLGRGGQGLNLYSYGDALLHKRNDLRNVLIAPGGVVSSVYPLQGNEAVIGLNLLGVENASYQEAQNARRSKDVVLAGPYKLRQGGEALTGRLAVFIPQADGTEKYWGLVSVTMDYPKLFSDAALDYLQRNDYYYSLEKKNGNALEHLLSYNPDKMKEPEIVPFNLFNMSFVLCAEPADGWYDYNLFKLGLLATLGISFLLSYVLGHIIESGSNWQEKATKDSLTGLLNRDAAFKMVKRTLQADSFEKGAFIVLDVDNFKSVNDLFGHQIGDTVLKDVAKSLKINCRESDIIGRLGGDEFIIFMSYAGSNNFLENKLKSLREHLANTITYNGNSLTVTASMGVALTEDGEKEYKELYSKADEALYHVKKSGKNGISFSGGNKL